MNRVKKTNLVLGIAFVMISGLFFVTSIIFLNALSDKKERRVLFVHNDIDGIVYGVPLGVRIQERWQDDVFLFAQAMLMPPAQAYQRPFFVSGVRVKSVIKVDKVTYVSLNMESDKFIENSEADFTADLALFTRALQFNFPTVEQFAITVNGFEVS